MASIFDRLDRKVEPVSPAVSARTYSDVRPLTASAARINLSIKKDVENLEKLRQANKWQEDAWNYYDLVGELKFAANLLANVASRVRLYPAFIVDKDAIPSIIDDIEELDDELKKKANEALMLLASGNGGISGLLRDAALNLFVAGECFLVKEPAKLSTNEPEKWQIRSVSELIKVPYKNPSDNKTGYTYAIKESKNAQPSDYIVLPPKNFMGRIWRTHPRFSADADSSLLGILELLDELLLNDKSARTTTRSRLGSGLLYLPDEIDNVAQFDGDISEDGEETPTGETGESIAEELMESIIAPIKDEGSAAAAAPFILRGPGQYGDQIKLIKFERTFDPIVVKRGERVMERILAALDLPKDIVSGLANIKYSNAIVIEQSLYRAHVEPLILMIVDSLTEVFLRPVLRGLEFPEELISRVTVWYDAASTTAKPDKASAANTGYENKIVSGAAWRRENGFSETDAPTQLELAQQMAMSKGLMSEPVTEALLRTLVPDILDKVRQDQLSISDPGSAAALSDALDPTTTPAPAASDTIDSETNTEPMNPPTELIEP